MTSGLGYFEGLFSLVAELGLHKVIKLSISHTHQYITNPPVLSLTCVSTLVARHRSVF
jgi:hypothetical protein